MLDLTVAAVPFYFGTMAAEHRYLQRRAQDYGSEPADYTKPDTVTSLAMGTGSLLVPLVMPKLLAPMVPGKGKHGRKLVAGVVAGAIVTTVADRLADVEGDVGTDAATPRAARRRRVARIADRVRQITGPATVAAGITATGTWFGTRWDPKRQWERRGAARDRGINPATWAIAIAGWDAIYYWNHRLAHEIRALWAVHVVHHSSERYNLSTALRQPVHDSFSLFFVPYGLMSRFGIRPYLVAQARAVNLIYQYWIHTETIRSLGPAEEVLNTPSHHRVHHGSQPEYLDRNHGSILIIWDRLFGTFQREEERVVYGLTKNIETFDLEEVADHEFKDILRDVSRSTNWRDRLSFVLRGPGWAYDRHRQLANESDIAAATVAAPSESSGVE